VGFKVANKNDSGDGSLRKAIVDANASSNSFNIIDRPSSHKPTIAPIIARNGDRLEKC